MTKHEALACLDLVQRSRDPEQVRGLLNWIDRRDGDRTPESRALVHYLIHYVRPVVAGDAKNPRPMPSWVWDALFRQEPEEAAARMGPGDFLAHFPGRLVVGLSDLRDRPGKQIEEREWLDSMVPEARKIAYAVYFTPNGMGETRNEKGHLRHDLNASSWNAVFVDHDSGKGPDVLALLGSFAEPSAIVETRKGYHAYWLLEPRRTGEPGTEGRWRALEQAAIAATRSDPAASNPSRLMRVPGAWHCKGEPYLVRLVSWTGRRYGWEELGRLLGVDLAREAARQTPSRLNAWQRLAREYAQADRKPKELRPPAVQALGEGYRHGTAKEEVARMYAGLGEDLAREARDAARLWYENSCVPLKRGWEREIEQIVDWVEAREYGRVVSR